MIYRRPHKYRAKRCEINGEKFDSVRELRRWHDLKLLEKAGKISRLERQVPFRIIVNDKPVLMKSTGYPNGRQVKYVADFVYFEDNKRVVEDSKGIDTPVSRLKRALVEAIYDVQVKVT